MERKYVIENTEGQFYAEGHWVQRQLATEYEWGHLPWTIQGTDGEEWEQECFDYRPDDPDVRYYPEGAGDNADVYDCAVVRVIEE